jgi:hypothetical protein
LFSHHLPEEKVMRLWSLHPCYLDSRGLVALWREALLAQKVLQGGTRGYRHHPQLERFRQAPSPQSAIASYLRAVHEEALVRGFSFDRTKIGCGRTRKRLPVSQGQLAYEFTHLLSKLKDRDPVRHESIKGLTGPEPHPLFQIVPGEVAPWEKGASKEVKSPERKKAKRVGATGLY